MCILNLVAIIYIMNIVSDLRNRLNYTVSNASLRQGANLLNDMIVTYVLPALLAHPHVTGSLSSPCSLSSMLMARFLLNLRDHRSRTEDITYIMSQSEGKGRMSTSPVSTLRFKTDLLDSMAASVGTTDEDLLDDDDDETACEHDGTVDKHAWLEAHHVDSKDQEGVLVLGERGASWV